MCVAVWLCCSCAHTHRCAPHAALTAGSRYSAAQDLNGYVADIQKALDSLTNSPVINVRLEAFKDYKAIDTVVAYAKVRPAAAQHAQAEERRPASALAWQPPGGATVTRETSHCRPR